MASSVPLREERWGGREGEGRHKVRVRLGGKKKNRLKAWLGGKSGREPPTKHQMAGEVIH